MASANPLDDFLSSSVDESVISELVGSLESQLASPTDKEKKQELSELTSTLNHVNSTPKFGGINSVVNTTSTSSVTTNERALLNLTHDVQKVTQHVTYSAPNTNAGGQSQLLGISSIVGGSNVQIVNPAGANAISGTSLPTIISAVQPVSGVSLLSTNPNGIVTTKPLTPANVQQTSAGLSAIPGGNIQNNSTSSVKGTASSAMYDLASIAAEQKPLIVPNTTTRSLTPVTNVNIVNKSDVTLISRTSPVPTTVQRPQFIIKHDNALNSGIPVPRPQFVIKQDPQIKIQVKADNSNANDNANNTSIIRTIKVDPTSTNNRTSNAAIQPQTVTVVRPTTLPGTVQVVSGPRPIMAPGPARTLAPRIIQNQVRIAAGTSQARMIAPTPGSAPNTIRLPAGFQLPPGAVFMKNEQGQLIMVTQQPVQSQQLANATPGATVRLSQAATSHVSGVSTVHTVARARNTTQGQQTVKVVSAQSHAPGVNQQIKVEPRPVASAQSAAMSNEAVLENVKKCRNFLSTLIKLAAQQPKETVTKVRKLIQDLVDGKLEPESFTTELQDALSSSPQPYLVPFLKKSLPFLRQSLAKNEFTIEGVRPPGVMVSSGSSTVSMATPVSTISAANQLQVMSQLQQLKHSGKQPSPELIRQFRAMHHLNQQRGLVSKGESGQFQHNLTPQQVMLFQQAHQLKKQQDQAKAIQAATIASGSIPSTVNIIDSKSVRPGISVTPAHKEKRKFESSLKDGDDDINDVATMGGVNLTEESRNILATANADFIGAQTRSCKDENFLYNTPLLQRMSYIAHKHGLTEIPPDVVNLISHATQERLRHLVERLATVAEHRLEIYKTDSRFEVSEDVRAQLKFFEELDKLEKKRHQEQEREMLLRAAKSRSKNEDPEQLKLKQKARELQQAEQEEVRQREANLTALNAIGPRKKRKLDTNDSLQAGTSLLGSSSAAPGRNAMRPRIKRVNLRDLIFILEQDKESNKSDLLYKLMMK